MIFGSISSHDVHHQSLARYVDGPNPNAARKVESVFVKKLIVLQGSRQSPY
ncbi:MAG: hypothetical protein K2W92_03080 [Alphaproteobacteria bacterium]|nr:hypothetical protein [Alphaproteobacteria bacterium]